VPRKPKAAEPLPAPPAADTGGALKPYAAKRNFDRTPEPAPAPVTSTGHSFCVQRHRATRLHYDLRLEIHGTLVSWAVPQGPALDPAVKRLAMHVEDHPLDYGSFEGNIPKGNYGAGSVMLWDRGTWELLGDADVDAQLARGDFKFRLAGEKLRGEFALVKIKGSTSTAKNEWLLLKKKDAHAIPGWDAEAHAWSVKTGRTQEQIAFDEAPAVEASMGIAAPLPTTITPMLATLAAEPPQGTGWVHEIKWDGVRALCFVERGNVSALGRKGTPITAQYPELAQLAACVDAETAVLDGEIAAPDERGRPSFERLQPRIMATGAAKIAQLARSRPVRFFAFDLLYLNGRDLRGLPLEERHRLLVRHVKPAGAIALSEQFPVTGAELLAAARAQGLEGIVAKHALSRYHGGRSKEWLKIKATTEADLVLCGYTEGERDHFGALALGIYDGGELKFAGTVGTGFDQKTMQALRAKLDPLAAKRSPFSQTPKLAQTAHWVKPQLVARVKYLEWTSDGKLRAPVFIGLRDDIGPEDCQRTAELAATGRAALLSVDKTSATVSMEGQSFVIGNLDKVFYPETPYTKRDLIEYYHAVAPLLLPHLLDRPLSLRRYPDGIAKDGFFQKNAAELADWLRSETIVAEDGNPRKMVIGGRHVDLIYLAHLGCIDQNPWMSRLQTLDHPDYILIDLDPHQCAYDKIVEAALLVRRRLDQIGLAGYPKTTGGDGMHIYIPLEPVYLYEHARAFAEILARIVVRDNPDLFTTPRSVARRVKGRVYFDWMQIARGKTISAPYVPRAYAGAPVATPLEWREVRAGLNPKQFHIRNVLARFDALGDLFAPVLSGGQRLEDAIERMERILTP
jgi:bifunctional non-homologous end joining protein LigD